MAFCLALLAGSFFATRGGSSGLAGGVGSGFATTLGGASGLGTGLAFTFGGTSGAFSVRDFSRAANCRKVCPYMELRGYFAFNWRKAAMASWVRPAFW